MTTDAVRTVGAAHPTSAGVVPWPPDVAASYVAAGYWREKALGTEIYAAAGRRLDHLALADGDVELTYRDLMARADGAATRLLRLGLEPDDRIVVQLPNSWEFVVLVLGCLRAGIVPVMALPAHRRHELTHLAEQSEAVAIAVPDRAKDVDHQALAHEIAAAVPTVRHILVAGADVGPGSTDLRALLAPSPDPDQARARLDAAPPDPYAVAVFLLSGGTTGLPKLIARTHNDYAYNARRSAEVCGLGPDDVYLGVLPLGHNFPLACPGLLGAFLCGATVVVAPSPEPARVWDLIGRRGVTVTAAVPAVAQRWLEHAAGRPATSLRLLQVGGARLADELARRVTPVLGCQLQQVFGMAEGLLNYTRLDDPTDVVSQTQGRPMSEADELRVVDELGEDVPGGQPGILLTRGPYTPRGYYRAPEHNGRAFTAGGWYRTGDVVRLRPDGNLVVEGRDKDMINRGGEKISAEEVENFAYQVPGVSLAAAVAMPDAALGERVCLYAVVEREVTVEALHATLRRAGVARFKWPERLVVVAELPTTKVGKIDKKALRADIATRLDAEADTDRGEQAVSTTVDSPVHLEVRDGPHQPVPSEDLAALYRGFEQQLLIPLWTEISGLMPAEPKSAALPHIWRWQDLLPLAERAGALVPVGRGGERRAIALANPGLGGRPFVSPNLWAAIQYLMPGEDAPEHRHSQHAFRFVVEGEGVWTVVGDDPVAMRRGDFLPQAGWNWHAHHNATDEPMAWIDGLDIPFQYTNGTQFFEPGRERLNGDALVLEDRSRSERLWGHPGLVPVGVDAGPAGTPLLAYRWEHTDRALTDQLELASAGVPGVVEPGHAAVRFTHPGTGKDVLPTIRAEMHRVVSGVETAPARQIGSSVYQVFDGSGTVTVGDHRWSVTRGDLFVVPSWEPLSIRSEAGASDSDSGALDLFRFSDAPLFELLHLDGRR